MSDQSENEQNQVEELTTEQEEADEALELQEIEKIEAAGPLPGETRAEFASRLHTAQVARHKQRRANKVKRSQKGLVIVNTGNGKGKTTAALGVLFRAWGRGMRVCCLQFIKATTSNYGEERAARRLGIEMIPMGDGFTWTKENIEKDMTMARQCWEMCKEKISSGDYDIVILDEMTYAFTYGWLDITEIIEFLKQRQDGMHIIITGRNAPPELIEYADLVTEMTEIKHPYKEGIQAQKGIEF